MELKFKILVLRLLMMIIHRLVSAPKDKADAREVDRLAVDVHLLIQEMDRYVALTHAMDNTPEIPPAPSPAIPRVPLRMKSTG